MGTSGLRPRRLLLQASVCALAVRALLRCTSLPTTVRVARQLGFILCARARPDDCVAAAATAVRHFAHPTCLYRALTEYALLAHRCRLARFHLGATRSEDLAAHAWVTVDGHALDAEASRYIAIWTASVCGPGC